MTITKTIIAFAAFAALVPSGASAAALYGGGTASVAAPGVSVTAGANAGATSSADQGIGEAPDTSVSGSAGAGIGVSLGAAAQVHSDADLNLYTESVKAEDTNVASVDAEGNGVSVAYWHPGHLFGIFPVMVKSETSIALDERGEEKVDTHMPWWNFFVTGTDDTSTMVDEDLSASAQVSADLKMADDAGARARLLAAIVAAHAKANAAASASVSAEQH